LAYGTPGNAVFGAGAIFGSMVWFIFFGAVLCWLGARLNQLNPWRAIDGLVAIMMLGTALYLMHSFWLLKA
jgi:L-lysine exporter family protein LysE/ArgO